MSVDDYLKGKETTPCPISSDAAGKMVVGGLYRNSVVAWREAVSNACDAMRHSEEKVVKVYTNNKDGDAIIEDWGTGIEDNDHFQRFIGIGRIREKSSNEHSRDDKEIGRFGVGKNSYLGLSKIKLVQFYSHSNKNGVKRGMIVTFMQEPRGEIKYVNPPDYLDSGDVLPHRGMKVIIRKLLKPMSTSKLSDYLGKRFALKIARGYKIFVNDLPVYKPESFDSTKKPVLFKLNNGTEVYGNLKNVEKPKNENIDVLVNQVYIESLDFEWKVEGWINCDELELTTSREGISTEEDTVYPEFLEKLEDHLSKNFDPKDTDHTESVYEKDWEEIASKAILKYYKQLYTEDTCKFLEGIATKLGLKGTALKGGQMWKTLENSDLTKIENPVDGGSIQVKRVKKKNIKKKGNKKKWLGKGGTDLDNKYEIIPGEGLVAVKENGSLETEEEEEVIPHIPFKKVPKSKEKPLVYFDDVEQAFILNSSWVEGIKMFSNPKSDGARNEILRAIVRATPENLDLSTDDLDKKYYTLVDSMSGK